MDRPTLIAVVLVVVCTCAVGTFFVFWKKSSSTNAASTPAPQPKLSKVEQMLEKHATVQENSQDHSTVDNFSVMKDIFDRLVETLPQDVQKQLACEQLTRQNINDVMKCLRMQVPANQLNDDMLNMMVVAEILIHLMALDPFLRVTEILTYDPVTKMLTPRSAELQTVLRDEASRKYLKVTINGEEMKFRKDEDGTILVLNRDADPSIIDQYNISNMEFRQLFIYDPEKLTIPSLSAYSKFMGSSEMSPRSCPCKPSWV